MFGVGVTSGNSGEPMATPTEEEPLEQLSLARHRDLEGRHWGVVIWLRWVITGVLVALHRARRHRPARAVAEHPGVVVIRRRPARQHAGSRLRGGLIFQTGSTSPRDGAIAHPTIVLDGGWFDGMTLNSVQPGAGRPVARGRAGSTFAYPQLAAGQTLTVWFEWSVNPTNLAWRRPETLRLADGSQTLLTQHSTVTVLP